MAIIITAYHWDFGDGHESDEQNPLHTYAMAGTYIAILTITDSTGYSTTATFTIYVYENDYLKWAPAEAQIWAGNRELYQYGYGYNVTKTDRCLRYALPQEPLQGTGWCEYNGDEFPFPTGLIGTQQILNDIDERVMLVIDCNTFKTYQLGREDVWIDGQNDEYAGAEFESLILLREHTPPIGADATLEHSQSHLNFKPWYKDQRNEGDFNSEGYRSTFEADLLVRTDSQPTDRAVTRRTPREGKIVFDRHFMSKYLQMGTRVRGAPWRLPNVQQWYRIKDSMAGPILKQMTEHDWMLELSEPLIWIPRDSDLPDLQLPLNYGTGVQVTGSYAGLATGPDNRGNSAYVFGAAQGFNTPIDNLSGDFTLIMWVRSAVVPVTLFELGTLTIVLSDADTIEWNDTDNALDIPFNESIGNWTMVAFARRNMNMVVTQNGVLVNTYEVGDEAYSGTAIFNQGAIAGYDMRLIPRSVSIEALLWLYNDVIDNNGESTGNIF